MTNNPFAIEGNLWLYWLFTLELIPGGWSATFYLEENETKPEFVFTGFGNPSNAVKEAFNEIDKEWLEKGFAEGKILNEQFNARYEKDKKKNEYWYHYLSNEDFWGNRFTEKKLSKIKDIIWEDQNFWDDILLRHDGQNLTPKEMKEKSNSVYEHCMGNMTGMLMKSFIQNGIIKP